jgi:hypothetical protein
VNPDPNTVCKQALEEAIRKIRKLPEAEQDEAAAMLLSVASKDAEAVELDAETRTAIREGREEALEGKFVSDKDMAAFFRRHGVKRYQASRFGTRSERVPNLMRFTLISISEIPQPLRPSKI